MTNTNAKQHLAQNESASAASPIIFAPATALGASGVAVMRISGNDISSVLNALGINQPLKPRYATLCNITNAATGATIDQALALYFPAPHSFTGEEVLELHTHGGLAIRNALIQCLSNIENCRFAQAGEFSERAFYNGKMDLLQAEAIADLIAAETSSQHQLALSQLDGAMSNRYDALRSKTLHALALFEAYIDFPDEEIPEETLNQVNQLVATLTRDIQELLEHDTSGEIIRDGFCIAIIGPPNAGKSSLLNALAKREAAIVSDIAGTTRDQIEIHLNLNGYLVRLIDTAGIRTSSDVIESEGIRRAKQAAKRANLKLGVFDIITNPEQYPDSLNIMNDNDLILLNKCDQEEGEIVPRQFTQTTLAISAKTGEGIDQLLQMINNHIEQHLHNAPTPALTRARHREALAEALQPLLQFNPQKPLELSCEELRQAAVSIGKITGKIEVDQLLDVIFREFCIGK